MELWSSQGAYAQQREHGRHVLTTGHEPLQRATAAERAGLRLYELRRETMPLQQIITTWFALNGSNDESPSGVNDLRTGAPQFVGGLNIGDYFDLTEQEANEHSWTQIGILHAG